MKKIILTAALFVAVAIALIGSQSKQSYAMLPGPGGGDCVSSCMHDYGAGCELNYACCVALCK